MRRKSSRRSKSNAECVIFVHSHFNAKSVIGTELLLVPQYLFVIGGERLANRAFFTGKCMIWTTSSACDQLRALAFSANSTLAAPFDTAFSSASVVWSSATCTNALSGRGHLPNRTPYPFIGTRLRSPLATQASPGQVFPFPTFGMNGPRRTHRESGSARIVFTPRCVAFGPTGRRSR